MKLTPCKNMNRANVPKEVAISAPVSQFRTEIDRVFDRFFSDPWGVSLDRFPGWNPKLWLPSVDVVETEKEVTVRAEVPGVDPKDLDLSISGNILTIAGEKKESTEKKGEDFYQTERRFGSFRRSVQLPSQVDAEKVLAEHENGVLTVKLKKDLKDAPRKIPLRK